MTAPNRTYLRAALYGGGIAAAVMIALGVTVGLASGASSRLLLEAALPTIRFLASAVATSAATTLALILTLLSLSANTDFSLDGAFYRRMRHVAQLDVATFIGAIVLLVVLVVPISEDSEMSGTVLTAIYYGLSAFAAITAGLLVAVVLALYGAVHDLIETCWLDDEPLAAKDPDKEPTAEVA